MVLYRLSQRQLPALIAILAILLLFIAPDISQSLRHRQSADAEAIAVHTMSAMGEEMNMADSSHSSHGSHGSHGSVAGPIDPTQRSPAPKPPHAMGMGMMDEFACGYCQLLVHVPMVIWTFIPVLLLMLLVSQQPRPRLLTVYLPIVYPGPCQPRAPPVF